MNSETEYDVANMLYRTRFWYNDATGMRRSFETSGETSDEAEQAMTSMREHMENAAYYGVKQPASRVALTDQRNAEIQADRRETERQAAYAEEAMF
jgi:hypothetical protein